MHFNFFIQCFVYKKYCFRNRKKFKRFLRYSSALNHREKFYSKQDLIDSRNVPMKTGYKLTHESKSLSLEIEKVSILDAGFCMFLFRRKSKLALKSCFKI